MEHAEERDKMAKCAYSTIANEWNAEVAAERLIMLASSLLEKEERTVNKGCCSHAEGCW